MDKKLYETSIQGNITSLLNLLSEDPLIIHKFIVNPHHSETPLHIGALLGHEGFVKEILARDPNLARELNSEGSTALHLASARGHVEIVRCLIEANHETCYTLDKYGMNPVHVAVTKGRVDALKAMVRARPDAARIATGDGLTVLHLCVKFNQLEALKFLVEVSGVVDEELVNSKDQDGNTVLHLAVLNKQTRIVGLLETSTRIDREARNGDGLTASDMLRLSNHIHMNSQLCNQNWHLEAVICRLENVINEKNEGTKNSSNKQKVQQAENRRNALMVAATVIMSMSFQVAVNPPSGVWQKGNSSPLGSPSTAAGNAILWGSNPSFFSFIVFDTIAFSGSTLVFLLLLSKLPFLTNNRYVMGAFIVVLWLAIVSSVICFTLSVQAITPHEYNTVPFIISLPLVQCLTYAMLGLLITCHLARFIWKKIKKLYAYVP